MLQLLCPALRYDTSHGRVAVVVAVHVPLESQTDERGRFDDEFSADDAGGTGPTHLHLARERQCAT